MSQTDTVFQRNPDAHMATVDNLVVLLNVEAGNYHGLNTVGTYIWEFLAEPRSAAEIAGELPRRFEVDSAQAEQATQAFLSDLAERGLVQQVEA